MKILPSKIILKDAKNGGLIGVGICITQVLMGYEFTLDPLFWIYSITFGFLAGFLMIVGNLFVMNIFFKLFPKHNILLFFPLLLIVSFISISIFYCFTLLFNIVFLFILPEDILSASVGVGIIYVIISFFLVYSREKEELLRLERGNRKLAVIEERNRIARELHDSVSQNLFGINLNLNNLDYILPNDLKEARKINKLTLGMIEEVQREMKLMIYELKPNALSEKGFLEAIKNLINLFRLRYNLQIKYQINGNEEFLDDQKQFTFYRVLQESLNNIVKHAEATKVIVILKISKKESILTVRDNGKGILTTEIDKNEHLGIKGMKERVEQMNGAFEIHSIPGNGTTINVKI